MADFDDVVVDVVVDVDFSVVVVDFVLVEAVFAVFVISVVAVAVAVVIVVVVAVAIVAVVVVVVVNDDGQANEISFCR